jgi:PAS domain S-box-containing protein
MLFDPASVVSDGMERSVLDALIETAVDCMKVMHPDGTLCHMNSHGQHAMELDSLDGVGQPWSSLWPPAGAQQVEAALRAAADGRSSRFQAFCPTAKGTARWWDVAVSPVHDASGAVSRVVAVSRDVTAVAEVERAAARSRERLGAVLRAAGMGEIELDLRTGHCARSAAVDEMFGVPPGSVDGGLGPLLARIHPADRARVEAELDRSETLGEAWSSEFRIVLPDRGLRWLAGSAQVEPGADGPPGRLLGILRDITERKAGDERLRESEHWRNLALEASGIGMWDYDVRSQAVTWTAECYAIHGVEPGEFDGTATVFDRALHPADRDRVWATVLGALQNKELYSCEFRILRPDGEVRWVSNLGRGLYDAEGQPIRMVGTITDITAAKQLEAELEMRVEARTVELRRTNLRLADEMARREDLQAALVQSQKLEALGQLTSGIAHDFNNAIAAIAGGFAVIEKRTDDPRIVEVTRHGVRAAERGAALVQKLLAFARQQVLAPEAVRLDAVLEEAEPLIRHSLGAGIEFASEGANGLPPVLVDPVQLETALINLAVNARDAMGEAGQVRLAARLCPVGEAERPVELRDAEAVEISVADTGPGMPPEVLRRVIEPFFTTKGATGGTGLGLAMVHGFLRQSGGALRIESRVGAGTTVRLFLPTAEALPAALEEAGAAPAPGEGVILLVDDDDEVRGVTGAQLADLGYTVHAARGGTEALALLDAVPEIRLVLTDVAMPGMGGAELARAVRRRSPHLPVLFMTGHADRALLEGETVLGKPFTSVTLAREAQRALEQSLRHAESEQALDRLATRLRADCLHGFLARWRAAKGAARLPDFAGFELASCEEPHRVVMLEVDATRLPMQFRYAHVGEGLEEALGRAMGGSSLPVAGVDEVGTPEAAYRRCASRGRPVYEYARLGLGDGEAEVFERLLLPWSTDGTEADRIVGIVVIDFDGQTNAEDS